MTRGRIKGKTSRQRHPIQMSPTPTEFTEQVKQSTPDDDVERTVQYATALRYIEESGVNIDDDFERVMEYAAALKAIEESNVEITDDDVNRVERYAAAVKAIEESGVEIPDEAVKP